MRERGSLEYFLLSIEVSIYFSTYITTYFERMLVKNELKICMYVGY